MPTLKKEEKHARMKKKTFVLMISKSFSAMHIRAGQPTEFRQKILAGEKIHTIRGNAELWEKREKMINKGDAVLSLREWEGKPYQSKQIEFARLERIGVQRVVIDPPFITTRDFSFRGFRINIRRYWDEERIPANDGLTVKDFQSWFPEPFAGCIIHFTDLRY